MNYPILFLGDTHGRHVHLKRLVEQTGPCTLVHLGDITPTLRLDLELADILHKAIFHFIHGNHDCDSDAYYDNVFGSTLAGNNLHGKVVTLEGVRIAGLGGNFQKRIWRPTDVVNSRGRQDFLRHLPRKDYWRGGLPRKTRAAIWPEDYERLSRLRADVLVCHEAPATHRHGFEVIDVLARAMGVKKIFHGHHHVGYQASINPGIEVHGVGLRGVTDIHGKVIISGELDEQRKEHWRAW